MAEFSKEPIRTKEELEFAVFCIENVAEALHTSGDRIYRAWTEDSDILNAYVVLCYSALHTQGRAYIVDDLVSLMEERGITIQ